MAYTQGYDPDDERRRDAHANESASEPKPKHEEQTELLRQIPAELRTMNRQRRMDAVLDRFAPRPADRRTSN